MIEGVIVMIIWLVLHAPAQDAVLLDHENHIRSLEGAPPLSLEEFSRQKSDAKV
jgi:hypothetical protein